MEAYPTLSGLIVSFCRDVVTKQCPVYRLLGLLIALTGLPLVLMGLGPFGAEYKVMQIRQGEIGTVHQEGGEVAT
jgi:hypothetical protein